jgi:hypothetical protein
MKKTIFIITILLLSFSSKSQNTGVEKSIYTIQTGILGAWVNNEYRLSNEISLKSELGMIVGLRGCTDCKTLYALAPEITLEPRWYYNTKNRISKGRIIKNNSSNFVTLRVNYIPDWFVISNEANTSVESQISIIPKWGIKRTIANSNFNYELGIGIGKKYFFDSNQWTLPLIY